MSKELIERLRDISGWPEIPSFVAEAADLIEAQQKRVEELKQALRTVRPFINAWPQCRDAELKLVDAALEDV